MGDDIKRHPTGMLKVPNWPCIPTYHVNHLYAALSKTEGVTSDGRWERRQQIKADLMDQTHCLPYRSSKPAYATWFIWYFWYNDHEKANVRDNNDLNDEIWPRFVWALMFPYLQHMLLSFNQPQKDMWIDFIGKHHHHYLSVVTIARDKHTVIYLEFC